MVLLFNKFEVGSMSQIASDRGILDTLADVARGAVQGRGLRIQVKTNLGPPVTIYDYDDPSQDGPAFIKAGLVMTDRFGKPMATYGTIPETDYILVGSAAVFVAMVTVLIVRGLRK